MEVAVVDTETTGIGESHQVIEYADVRPSEGALPHRLFTQLICPTRPIDVEAMGAHHITPEMLESEPTAADWAPNFTRTQVMVAHNLEFDRQHILQTWPGLPLPPMRICTWRCALHVWPDAPSHKNQVLRYWLEVPDPTSDLPPHRSLPDAEVTCGILLRLLDDHSLEDLVQMTLTPALLRKVRFGKNYGKLWEEMDFGFLRWVLEPRRDFDADVVHTAQHWLEKRYGRR